MTLNYWADLVPFRVLGAHMYSGGRAYGIEFHLVHIKGWERNIRPNMDGGIPEFQSVISPVKTPGIPNSDSIAFPGFVS